MRTKLNELADELMKDGIDYCACLRNKICFAHSGNGDIYAFDMSFEGEDKPVVYWYHEEGDDCVYLADCFIDFLEKITDLYCIWKKAHTIFKQNKFYNRDKTQF